MSQSQAGMPLIESLSVLREIRGDDEVVLTVMGTAREWMALGEPHPLDWIYVPSSMGQAPSLGLGMALAQPDKQVIVCNGDGCMLMNLGSLVTITNQAASNYTLIIFDNGVYEITGGQPTPATSEMRRWSTIRPWPGPPDSSRFSSSRTSTRGGNRLET